MPLAGGLLVANSMKAGLRTEIKAAKYPSECRFFCHIYSVTPPSVEGKSYRKYEITDLIPDELWTVAHALITRSGIVFLDSVSSPEHRKAKGRKPVPVAEKKAAKAQR